MAQQLQTPLRATAGIDSSQVGNTQCEAREVATPFHRRRPVQIGAVLLLLAAVIAIIIGVVVGTSSGSSSCQIEGCASVSVPAGAKDCSQATCSTCQTGRSLTSDAKGSYCGLSCVQNCDVGGTAERGATSCDKSAQPQCEQCSAGYEFDLDIKSLMPTGQCRFACTRGQELAGCSPGYCSADGTCSRCVPGFTKIGSSDFLGAPRAQTCTAAAVTVPMNFYMYRAQNDQTYPPDNTDLASAAGVMWYLHNEVVRICPRKFGITRILRYNVTVFNPPAVFGVKAGQFGHFVQFDSGKCTVDGCNALWQQPTGYMVGCQPQAETFHYHNSFWYSIPGSCPSKDFSSKTPDCEAAEPGGKCDSPTGAPTCTWSAVLDGEVQLDELSGITNYAAFCAEGNVEYDLAMDAGRGNDFWDERNSDVKNKARVLKLMQLFAKHYPTDDATMMPDALCNGF